MYNPLVNTTMTCLWGGVVRWVDHVVAAAALLSPPLDPIRSPAFDLHRLSLAEVPGDNIAEGMA